MSSLPSYPQNPIAFNVTLSSQALERAFAKLDDLTVEQINRLMVDAPDSVLLPRQQLLESAMKPLAHLYDSAHAVMLGNRLDLDLRMASTDPFLDRMGVVRTGEQLRSAMRFELSYMRAIIQGQDLDILNWILLEDADKLHKRIEKARAKAQLLERIILRRYRKKNADEKFEQEWAAYHEFERENQEFIEEIERVAAYQQKGDACKIDIEKSYVGLAYAIEHAQRMVDESARQYAAYTHLTAHDLVDALLENLTSAFGSFELSKEELEALQSKVEVIVSDMGDDYVEAVDKAIANVGEVISRRKAMQPADWPEPKESTSENKNRSEEDTRQLEQVAHQTARGAQWHLMAEDLVDAANIEAAHPSIVAILKACHLSDAYDECLNKKSWDAAELKKIIDANPDLINAGLAWMQAGDFKVRVNDTDAYPILELRALLYGKGFDIERIKAIIVDHPNPDSVLRQLLPQEGGQHFKLPNSPDASLAEKALALYEAEFIKKAASADTNAFRALLSRESIDYFDALLTPEPGKTARTVDEAKQMVLSDIEDRAQLLKTNPTEKSVDHLMDALNIQIRQAFIPDRREAAKAYKQDIQAWIDTNRDALSQGFGSADAKMIKLLHEAENEAGLHKRRRERSQEHLQMYQAKQGNPELLGCLKALNNCKRRFADVAVELIKSKRKSKGLDEQSPNELTEAEEAKIREEVAPQCFGQMAASHSGDAPKAGIQPAEQGRPFQDIATTVLNVSRFLQNAQEARLQARASQAERVEAEHQMRASLGLFPTEDKALDDAINAVRVENFANAFSALAEAHPGLQQDIDAFLEKVPEGENSVSAQEKFRDHFSKELAGIDRSVQVQLQSYMLLKFELPRLEKKYPNRLQDAEQEQAWKGDLIKQLSKEAFRKAYMESFQLRDNLPPELQSASKIEAEISSVDKRFLMPKQKPAHREIEEKLKTIDNEYRNGACDYTEYCKKLEVLLDNHPALNSQAQAYLKLRHRQASLRQTLANPRLSPEDKQAALASVQAIEAEKESLGEQEKHGLELVMALSTLNGLRLQMDKDMSQANGLLAALAENPEKPFSAGQMISANKIVQSLADNQAQYAKAFSQMQNGKALVMALDRPAPVGQNVKALGQLVDNTVQNRVTLQARQDTLNGLNEQMQDLSTQIQTHQATLPELPESQARTPLSQGAQEVLDRIEAQQKREQRAPTPFRRTPL